MITNIELLDSRAPDIESKSKTANNSAVMQLFELIATQLLETQLEDRKMDNPDILIHWQQQHISILKSKIKLLESELNL